LVLSAYLIPLSIASVNIIPPQLIWLLILICAFRGKYPVRSKITLDKNSIIEQASDFKYLGCNVTYKCDEDLNNKINTFQSIYGAISKTLKRKVGKRQI
jgi:hypothetical protein